MRCLEIRGWLIIIQPYGKYYVHACIRARACGSQTLIGHMYIRVCSRLGISACSYPRYVLSSARWTRIGGIHVCRHRGTRAFVDWEFAREWETVPAFPWTFDKRVTFRLRFIASRILDIPKIDTNECTGTSILWLLTFFDKYR